jgi:hypothetical protein
MGPSPTYTRAPPSLRQNLRIASTIPPNTEKRGERETKTKTCREGHETKQNAQGKMKRRRGRTGNPTRYIRHDGNTVVRLAAHTSHAPRWKGSRAITRLRMSDVGDDHSLRSSFGLVIVFLARRRVSTTQRKARSTPCHRWPREYGDKARCRGGIGTRQRRCRRWTFVLYARHIR